MTGTPLPGGVDRRQNGRTPFRNTVTESGGLAVAELASMVFSLGTVAVLDQLAPGMMKSAAKSLSKAVFEPYLDHIEKIMSRVCKLEECQPDQTKSRQERAEQLAYATLLFIPSFVTSLGAKILARRGMNHLCGIAEDKIPGQKWWQVWKLSRHEKMIFFPDEITHVGSLLLFNTGAAHYTDDMIRSARSVLEKAGMPKENAARLANMALIWEVPNAIGLMAGIGGVAGNHYGVWDKHFWPHWDKVFKAKGHVAKLEAQVSSGHSIPHV